MYRLDEWLVKKGIFESRKRAIKYIREIGVYIDGKHVIKPSYRITPPINLQLDSTLVTHYNKPQGYHKLARVTSNPKVIPFSKNDVCLDVGANVGGFSLYMLEQGVKSVDAIEISPQFEKTLKQIAVKWPNFSYKIANFFDIANSLPRKYNIITADMTIDPHFLLQNLEKFFLPLTSHHEPKQLLITVKLGKNFVNIKMTSKIEETLHLKFPEVSIHWLDSLLGRQEKILLVKP